MTVSKLCLNSEQTEQNPFFVAYVPVTTNRCRADSKHSILKKRLFRRWEDLEVHLVCSMKRHNVDTS